MPNVITAIFNKKAPDVDTAPIYQYNYGQVLRIEGLDLPPAVGIILDDVLRWKMFGEEKPHYHLFIRKEEREGSK